MVFSLSQTERAADRINPRNKKTGIKPVFFIAHD